MDTCEPHRADEDCAVCAFAAAAAAAHDDAAAAHDDAAAVHNAAEYDAAAAAHDDAAACAAHGDAAKECVRVCDSTK